MAKYTASDLPLFRSLRDAYRLILNEANAMKKESNDTGELIALCTIIDELQGKFDSVGRKLSRLENCPS